MMLSCVYQLNTNDARQSSPLLQVQTDRLVQEWTVSVEMLLQQNAIANPARVSDDEMADLHSERVLEFIH